MITYIEEAEENIEMDVQVGPKEEISADVEKPESPECPENGSEASMVAKNPVAMAKMNPETINVAGISKEGVKEFYVDAADVEVYADLTEQTMLESLNDIIAAHQESGMTAQNLVIIMDESTACYARNLEAHGAACVMNEADDITVDVQVGPEKDEMDVKADPQEANPVDAVKREYNSVVVAKNDDKFFMDVEDVQKCAELRCESVIDTLNGIIDLDESGEMCAENICVICDESAYMDTLEAFEEAGVQYVVEAFGGDSGRKKMIKKAAKVLRRFLVDQGCMKIKMSTFYIGGENADFVKGEGNTMLIGMQSTAGRTTAVYGTSSGTYTTGTKTDEDARVGAIETAAKIIRENKGKLKKILANEFPGYKVNNIRIEDGRLGVYNVAITVAPAGSEE